MNPDAECVTPTTLKSHVVAGSSRRSLLFSCFLTGCPIFSYVARKVLAWPGKRVRFPTLRKSPFEPSDTKSPRYLCEAMLLPGSDPSPVTKWLTLYLFLSLSNQLLHVFDRLPSREDEWTHRLVPWPRSLVTGRKQRIGPGENGCRIGVGVPAATGGQEAVGDAPLGMPASHGQLLTGDRQRRGVCVVPQGYPHALGLPVTAVSPGFGSRVWCGGGPRKADGRRLAKRSERTSAIRSGWLIGGVDPVSTLPRSQR